MPAGSTTTTTVPPSTTTTTGPPATTTTTTSTTTTTVALSRLDFINGAPGGTCGNTQDGSAVVLKNLGCGGLNIGGGLSSVPEGPTPDGSTSRYALSCTGSSCTISANSTVPAVQTAAPDCTNTGCNFGTPLPVSNPAFGGIFTTCVMNTWASPASGTLDLSTGALTQNVPLSSGVFLTGNATQPCPKCSATGTPSSPGTGTCDRGPRATLTCVSTSSTGLTRDCPTGGANPPTQPCTPGGGICVDGSNIGAIGVNLTPLTTGTASDTDPAGVFCDGQTGGGVGCFGNNTCRTITENGSAAGAITPGTPANTTLASVFCIAATMNGAIDATANLPGPGAVSLPGTIEVN